MFIFADLREYILAAKILPIYPENPHRRHVGMAVEILKEGGVISYPTDTVYGVGSYIIAKNAIQKI